MRRRIALLLLALGVVAALAPAAASGGRVPQVVGGMIAPAGAWPWMADITMSISASGGQFEGSCGGSLIGDRWVLTAAHCLDLDPLEFGGSVEVTSVRVRIGASDLAVPGGTTLVSTAFFVNPAFDLATFSRDFALIRLPEPIDTQAVVLPTTADASRWAAGTIATVIGWGSLTEAGQFDTKLRQVDVPIVPDSTCGSSADYGAAYDPRSMICAGDAEGGRDSCFGDSGGPLLVPDGGSSWLQAGIVSWGDGCARPNKPGVYAAVGVLVPSMVAILHADAVAPVSPPTAETGAAARLSAVGASVGGTVGPGGLATSYRVDYGTSSSYGSSASGYAGAGRDAELVSTALTGLAPSTTYHYRVTAGSGAGRAVGTDRTFRTTALASLGKASLAGGKARVAVACLAGQAGTCTGTLRITSSGGSLLVGKSAISVAPGSTVRVAVALSARARARLQATGRFAVKTRLAVEAGSLTATLTSSSILKR